MRIRQLSTTALDIMNRHPGILMDIKAEGYPTNKFILGIKYPEGQNIVYYTIIGLSPKLFAKLSNTIDDESAKNWDVISINPLLREFVIKEDIRENFTMTIAIKGTDRSFNLTVPINVQEAQ